MRYICAQPGELYFCWQIDVMIHSFINVGIEQKKIDIIFSDFKKDIEYYLELKYKYPEVNFHIYPDTRKDIKYVSSIRPHILKKHFKKHWWKYRGTFLYHDCDIVLTKPLELGTKISGCDPYNYLSNTKSYIGYEYILSKGKDVLDLMCEIADINKELLKINQDNSGGAQYLLKDINAEFWEKVETDSENLYYNVFRLNNKKKKQNKEYHPLQIWCADMWALLWNLWKEHKPTKIIKELDFVWPNEPYESIQTKSIIHNAGVTNNENKMFYKRDYVSRLPNLNLYVDENKASYFYYNTVKKALSY